MSVAGRQNKPFFKQNLSKPSLLGRRTSNLEVRVDPPGFKSRSDHTSAVSSTLLIALPPPPPRVRGRRRLACLTTRLELLHSRVQLLSHACNQAADLLPTSWVFHLLNRKLNRKFNNFYRCKMNRPFLKMAAANSYTFKVIKSRYSSVERFSIEYRE